MNIQIRHLILRYGVFALLGLMSSGILFFVCSFELRVKAPIHLFYDSNKHYWHGYLAEHKNAAFQPLDTLRIIQTSMGDFQCIVENIASEPGMLHIALRPIRKEVFPNTYCEGFVYVGKEEIKDKILSQEISIRQYGWDIYLSPFLSDVSHIPVSMNGRNWKDLKKKTDR